MAPELDAISEPVQAVVFLGPHHSVPVLLAPEPGGDRPAAATTIANVVCVVAPSGEELYYADVDLTGLNLDGLVVDRREE
jgi:hypothetical protein